MNVLHICAYYNSTAVFNKQFEKLKELYDVDNRIFVSKRIADNTEEINKKYQYVLFNKFNKLESILYYPRIHKSIKNIEKTVKLKEIELIHAHSIFTDGGIALQLKKRHNINYVVSVRKDTLEYLKKLPHASIMLKSILLNAKAIIYIAHNVKNTIYKLFDKNTINKLEVKSYMLTNGVDDFWLKNKKKKELHKKEYLNLIQTSFLAKGKKVDKTIKLTKYLNDNNIKTKLTIVGYGKKQKHYEKLTNRLKYNHLITFTGQIKDKQNLMELYNSSDIFIMPSVRETFGLVYIEAMSQGLPVLYKKGTGIDGIFKEKVGFAINKFNYKEIKQEIEKILKDYNNISNTCVNAVDKRFDWNNIATQLYKIYKGVYEKK